MIANKMRQKKIDGILCNMAIYYQFELMPETIDLYHELLAEHSCEDIAAACKVWMKKSEWFPRVNQIVDIIENMKGPQISIESRAQQQWRLVLEAIAYRGLHRGPPVWKDPITTNLLRYQFRWGRLCEMIDSELHWEEKRWKDAYALADELRDDLAQIEAPEKVMALVETIGDSPRQARKIMEE